MASQLAEPTLTNANGSSNDSIAADSGKDENPVLQRSRKFVLTKYTIYVTSQRMYIVGSNTRETVFRILEIDLLNCDQLVIMEDNVYFTRNEVMEVLNGIEDSSEGGLTKKLTAVGLLGFIKFTRYYYLIVVTKRKEVAVLGGHDIFHIEETEMIPVTNNPKSPEKNSIEARYVQIFLNIDLNKTFYYSYSYDLTNSLQTNMMRNKRQSLGLNNNADPSFVFQFNERFVWNGALLAPIKKSFEKYYDWFQPIIHGFIDQVQNSVFQIHFYITIIARRSHKFAGARFFKRGINDDGDVANEVETEQIVCDMLTSSFHDPAAGFYNNPRYTSFIQHRGSIPLSWSQETAPNLRMTKPPIEMSFVDPFYSRAALHFNDMFRRYGSPIRILNLIKQKEKTPRETKLLDAFSECIEYLNQFLPSEKKLKFTSWDMSRASKSRSQDVIKWLENYAEETLQDVGFFHNGKTIYSTKLQQGVCRTNCVDCLDRTNTAQFVIGKRALGYQLHALGIIKEKYLEYDSDVMNVLTEMFHDHGDTIALQYGGSHLVNTLQTYRKINQWSSHSRDMIESVKRFYSNSFVDAQRQEAINLFLGTYVYSQDKPMSWELNTDYYLHNRKIITSINGLPSYTHWFNDNYLKDKKVINDILWEKSLNPELVEMLKREIIVMKVDPFIGSHDNYWNIKYGSRNFISFKELFEFNMISTRNYSSLFDPKPNQPKFSDGETKVSKFDILGLFKKKEEEGKPESRGRFNSFSERLRGTSPKLPFDPEYEEGNYFSPFRSRKPHRELKQLFDSKGDENAIDDSSDAFFDTDSKATLHELGNLLQRSFDDENEFMEYRNECKELLFSLSQLERNEKRFEYFNKDLLGQNNIFERLNETNDTTIPVIKMDVNEYNSLNPVNSPFANTEVSPELQKISTESCMDDDLIQEFSKKFDNFKLREYANKHGVVVPTTSAASDSFYKDNFALSKNIPIVGIYDYIQNNINTNYENVNLDVDNSNNFMDSEFYSNMTFNKQKMEQLRQTYKKLADPFIDLGDLDKYVKQSKLLKQKYAKTKDSPFDVPNIKIFEQQHFKEPLNTDSFDVDDSVQSPQIDITTDSDRYFSFRVLGKNSSKPVKNNE